MRIARIGLTAVLLAAPLAACGDDSTPNAQPSSASPTSAALTLAITSPAAGATIGGNVVDLTVAVTGLTVVKADGDTTGTTGHLHAFIDREPVAAGTAVPKEAGIVHFAATTVRLPGLAPGKHTIKVVAGNGAHVRIGDAVASVEVTTSGPSIDASAPATVTAGADVPVSITATGLTVVKADGDTSGKSGHFHVFVDVDPAAPGDVIPKDVPGIIHSADASVPVKGLAKGEHTIWVVAGDGTHRAFSPLVADKVVVTVG